MLHNATINQPLNNSLSNHHQPRQISAKKFMHKPNKADNVTSIFEMCNVNNLTFYYLLKTFHECYQLRTPLF